MHSSYPPRKQRTAVHIAILLPLIIILAIILFSSCTSTKYGCRATSKMSGYYIK
jgi:hypothetical protein